MTAQRCLHFLYLPIGMRVLYTGTLLVLGIGYLFAMIHIFASHAGRDGDPGLSVSDLIIAYSGSKSDTKLEAALKGPMANMLPDAETAKIVAWVRNGADEKEYTENKVDRIIENRCLGCHNGRNPHIPNLRGFEQVKETVQADTGFDLFTLVRVSHIHLFGITFIFFICSSIFCHSYIKPAWLKCLVIITPFLAIVLDIGSWYLTKLFEPFAWVVMISGGLMGMAFAIQWCVSIYQMWFYKLPQSVHDDDGAVG